jgi:hypothetical protein
VNLDHQIQKDAWRGIVSFRRKQRWSVETSEARIAEVARDRRSVGGHASTDCVLQEKVSGEKLRFSKSEELKEIMTVRSKKTCVNRSCTSDRSTSRRSKCESLKLLKPKDSK